MCDETKNKIAPEGGWGYVVTAAIVLLLIIGAGHLSGFGILYGDFITKHGNRMEATSIATAMFFSFFNFIGLFANQLLKKYSCRFVCLLGTLVTLIAVFTNIFVSSLTHLYICYGVLQGAGIGIAFHAMYKMFNEYFIVKKNVMMCTAQSLYAATNIGLPYLTQFLMTQFGFRGTLLIFSGLYLNAIAAALTLQPVKWRFFQLNKEKCPEKCIGSEKEIIVYEAKTLLEKHEFYIENDVSKKKKNFWYYISDFLELSLLNDPVYVNIAFGLGLITVADILFVTLLPAYLFDINYDQDTVAYFMTLFIIADCIGRMILAIMCAFITVKNRYLLLLGVVTTVIARIVFTMINPDFYMGITANIVILGLLRCLLELPQILTLVEYSRSRFNAAYALFQIISALIGFIIGPLSKLIVSFDLGKASVIHMHTFFLGICGVCWLLEIIIVFVRNKYK